MENDLLVIGSVVKLKQSDNLVMIIGYSVIDEEKKYFDYAGCIHPIGLPPSLNSILFNKEEIEEVVYSGHQSKEVEEFKKSFTAFMAGITGKQE